MITFEKKRIILATRKYKPIVQYLISLFLIVVISVICFFTSDFFGYRVVALLLLLAVSVLAILFDIFPVLTAALFSALIWNFFFIPPLFNFHIDTPEDALMFLMYFVIALINAVLTYKIRDFERKERDRFQKEKSIELYNTILNSLSHELRTPISTIIGSIDTIKENETRLSASLKTELYTEIEVAGFRLNRQVENLLNMSRLEAKMIQPKLDWCDLNEVIFSIIHFNTDELKDHTLQFEPVENFPLFKLDRGFIEQILNNLVHNSVQYSPKGSIIALSIQHEERELIITVEDNGSGFPPETIDKVFDKFYRLNHSVTGGTGLGLSIVKGYVEAMNGTIALKNKASGGAHLTIIISAETSALNQLRDE